jgi:hypothetical protein
MMDSDDFKSWITNSIQRSEAFMLDAAASIWCCAAVKSRK